MKVKGIRKYARQFLLHVDPREIPAALDQMKTVSQILEETDSLKSLMVSPAFTHDEKKKAIEFLAQKAGMTEKVSRYVAYLSEERAITGLDRIVRSIEEAFLSTHNWVQAQVSAPVPLEEAHVGKLKDSLKTITGREVDLDITVDPSLLGGMKIQIGSTLYDGSIKGQLGLLRDKLIKG